MAPMVLKRWPRATSRWGEGKEEVKIGPGNPIVLLLTASCIGLPQWFLLNESFCCLKQVWEPLLLLCLWLPTITYIRTYYYKSIMRILKIVKNIFHCVWDIVQYPKHKHHWNQFLSNSRVREKCFILMNWQNFLPGNESWVTESLGLSFLFHCVSIDDSEIFLDMFSMSPYTLLIFVLYWFSYKACNFCNKTWFFPWKKECTNKIQIIILSTFI